MNDDQPKELDQAEHQSTASEKEKDLVNQQISEKTGGKLTMQVKVSSPFNVYFEGTAFSISGLNASGPFDILPKHHNFICLLQPCNLVIRPAQGEERQVQISGGLMHVKSDKVTVFLDI